MEKIVTTNEKQTWEAGFKLGKNLQGGEALALYGDLGAGKTKFLQGLSKGLGVKSQVNSPTFNILKLYKVVSNKKIKSFCHIDAYRLHSEKDLLSLGIEEFFEDNENVTAIEWAEKIKKIWPKNTIVIMIKHLSELNREITIKKQLVRDKL
ncbi:MAG: tRNA (adenosine(37)-N6)-threonylcarbamoyltransferase complex ATPase subunit type 1 TsaE [Patescibacteria group bacterium]